MKNKPLTKFKFENLVFIALVMLYLYGATTRVIEANNPFGSFSNVITLIGQIIMSYGLKMILAYIRKNPQTVAVEIASLFKEN